MHSEGIQNKMKCRCKTGLEKIAQTQPATTMTYASTASYYQCAGCGTLYQEITIKDAEDRPTGSGLVRYAGNLTKEEIAEHMPEIRGIPRAKDTDEIRRKRK